MKAIQLKHDYTIMEAYPNILFESLTVYNEYLKTHTEQETDSYIKQWISNRTIECIEKDIKDGVVKELPDGWQEEYTNGLNK